MKRENTELKRKLRIMEESYDRLMSMFQKQQSETKDKALAYKIEIEAAQETYRVAKTEKEKLKEVNEIQHKLWKIFVNKFEKEEPPVRKADKPADPKQPSPNAESNEEEVVIDDESEEIDLETSYEEWLKDTRSRGFKRKTPANAAEYNRVHQNRAEQKRRQSNIPKSQTRDDGRIGQEQVRYCHNWNNLGRCTYDNCKFAHQPAPLCKFDGECRRNKCMFSHEKQNTHFLSNTTAQPRPPMNQWQSMMSPWVNPFHFQPNPWQNMDRTERN